MADVPDKKMLSLFENEKPLYWDLTDVLKAQQQIVVCIVLCLVSCEGEVAHFRVWPCLIFSTVIS